MNPVLETFHQVLSIYSNKKTRLTLERFNEAAHGLVQYRDTPILRSHVI